MSSPNQREVEELRMTVNQISYAIMISILIVANMLLVWALAYIIVFNEKRGKYALKQYRAIKIDRNLPQQQQQPPPAPSPSLLQQRKTIKTVTNN